MTTAYNFLRPTTAAQPQADGDPGYSPVIYVDRRGNDQSADHYHGESDAEFCEVEDLHVCEV